MKPSSAVTPRGPAVAHDRPHESIRSATRADVDAIASIWRSGWADGHAGRVPAELERERRTGSWPAQVRDRLAQTWVAERDAYVVGFVTVVDDELEELYVAADARGSGVAATLLRHGERVVRDGGFTSAWLAVVAGNDRARRFYEREGWRDRGDFAYRARTAAGAIVVPARRYERLVAPPNAHRRDVDDATAELPAAVIARLRSLHAGRADVVEEAAWTGVRWRHGSVTIAHVVLINDGWPPAYARAACTDGPTCVLTVRCPREDVEALSAVSGHYFAPAWGINWNPSVLGIRLDDDTDWHKVAGHIDVSYRLATTVKRRRPRRASAERTRTHTGLPTHERQEQLA